MKDRLDLREPDDRSRLDTTGLPREVRPLVDAINDLLERHREQGEAQRQFIDDASHQLKTPIAVLRSQVDFALRADDHATARQTLEAMRPIIDRAARMTTQLLALARAKNASLMDGSQEAPTDLCRLLRDVARLHFAEARRMRIDLEVEVPEEPLFARGSEPLLFEAVSNLLDNALKASPRGGSVTLRAGAAASEGLVTAEVLDEGPGMDTVTVTRVGERFGHSGRPEHGSDRSGTGLGLAIVAAIVQAHGGSVLFINRPMQGLRASIVLAAAQRDYGTATESRMKARPR
ncbi:MULTISPECIES: ATP-binding protein [unclassified Aureimonas]|uniref:ATP-binding protein n=1 Tax=unclassified Aureimonas TaxID=2615206 RepID=UPI0006F7ECDC|nr:MULTISPECIES: ATP-binding protein [unclassified Aureimonas]KQT52292.1 hypothetical protein ASG62_16705 [Aureimonas sp. Leaf427]KQT61822.1 hypothetical protein ASG54_23640 [Aureimonas sp. Leaf460]